MKKNSTANLFIKNFFSKFPLNVSQKRNFSEDLSKNFTYLSFRKISESEKKFNYKLREQEQENKSTLNRGLWLKNKVFPFAYICILSENVSTCYLMNNRPIDIDILQPCSSCVPKPTVSFGNIFF